MGEEVVDIAGKWQQIDYLKPVYREGGLNCTEIGTSQGDVLLDRRKTKSVLKELVGVFVLDLGRAQRRYGNLVGRRSSCPIPLAQGYTLVPVKMRRPLVKDDGALGYVVKDRIETVESREKDSLLVMKNGHALSVLQQQRGIKNLFYDSEKVENFHLQQLGRVSENHNPEYTIECPFKKWIATVDKNK